MLLLALAFASCHRGERQTLRSALQMAYADPDSALAMLHTIDRRSLPPAEKAYYALTYYLAQDKSGLDVANDSLIRIAYNYYAKHPKDSLYARCMYYMGVYYSLSDSLERANYCLDEAAQEAKVQKDTATLCLVWSKNSWVVRKTNAPLGLKYASQALAVYRKYSQATPLNTIYYILLKGECERLCGKSQEALSGSKEAERIALALGDSVTLSNVYQDMSCFAAGAHDAKAVHYGLLSRSYSSVNNIDKTLSLAGAYYETGQYAACLNLLDTLQMKDNSQRYAAYKRRHRAAVKLNDPAALSYADSAYHYIEAMFDDELGDKTIYFENLMQEKTERLQAESWTVLYKVFCLGILIFIFIGLLLIAFVYKAKKKKMMAKVAYEKERLLQVNLLNERDRRVAELLHEQELKDKDNQIKLLHQYFVEKMKIKLKYDEQEQRHLTLTDADWEEIELFLERVDDKFVSKLWSRFPQLTINDIRLLFLLRLRLSTKTIAEIFKISEKSIKQKLYLYKKKIGVEGESLSLRKFIENF